LAISAAGAVQLLLTSTSVTVSNGSVLLLPAGTVTAPSLAFTGNTSTGFYLPATGQIGITAGGTQQVTVASTGFTLNNGTMTLPSGSAGTPALNCGTVNTGVYAPASSQLALTTAGAQRMLVDGNGLITLNSPSTNSSLLNVNSAQASAAVTITNSSTGPAMVVTSTGPYVISAENTTTPLNNVILTTPGSTASPAYSFAGRTGTGWYLKNTFPATASGGSDVSYFDGTSMVNKSQYNSHASKNGTSQIVSATNTIVQLNFPNQLHTTNSTAYNTSTNTYTAPLTGTYLVSSNVMMTPSIANTTFILCVIYNDINMINGYSSRVAPTTSSNECQIVGTWLITLSANDTISIGFSANSGSGGDVIVNDGTFSVSYLGF
jgi:hypothetical protein